MSYSRHLQKAEGRKERLAGIAASGVREVDSMNIVPNQWQTGERVHPFLTSSYA
jgi:hypothetical protein